MPPQADFVRQVGGGKVEVTVMVPLGASPHTYEPTPSQMTKVSNADMYAAVGSGVEFELAWMDRIVGQNENMIVVDCAKGIQLIPATADGGDEEGGRGHGAMDPHIWVSPLNAKTMVENICDGLVEIDPGSTRHYEERRDAYLQELTDLDLEIRNSLSGVAGRAFMVYHDSLGYFAAEYGLTMLVIEEEGKGPKAAGIAHSIDLAKEHGIDVIFASPRSSTESAEVIAREIGGRVALVDILAADYVSNLRDLTAELARAMGLS
jgi:zinc transport system substrate-binding protein